MASATVAWLKLSVNSIMASSFDVGSTKGMTASALQQASLSERNDAFGTDNQMVEQTDLHQRQGIA
ncbi:hypothetical protein D3C78_1188950 [compost metagenome]